MGVDVHEASGDELANWTSWGRVYVGRRHDFDEGLLESSLVLFEIFLVTVQRCGPTADERLTAVAWLRAFSFAPSHWKTKIPPLSPLKLFYGIIRVIRNAQGIVHTSSRERSMVATVVVIVGTDLCSLVVRAVVALRRASHVHHVNRHGRCARDNRCSTGVTRAVLGEQRGPKDTREVPPTPASTLRG